MVSEEQRQKESRLHPRNRNRERYDIRALITTNPELAGYVTPNKLGEDSIDFSDPVAVKILNRSLLNHYYGIRHWDFPDENLCPPILGRADYIHHLADLLQESNFGTLPKGEDITCYDIGTGASCIYPIIGVAEYGWNFIASDVNPKSIDSATKIVLANPSLHGKIECKLQPNPTDIIFGIIGKEEQIDCTLCNPPFHASSDEALKGTRRKVKNLTGKKPTNPTLNFSGISDELIYEGGEAKFIDKMVKESRKFAKNAYWFSTLVSKQSNVKTIYKSLEKLEATRVKTIPMGTGNKATRIVAWTFLSKEERSAWAQTRWGKKE
ncbi:MAG: 23S rRNA (adenine(1618)-N(6))-methyltransferase RlmF [Bacteroidales bacterium]|nr:23S rRNA (adenine(1618)-N(6))-methyltransferase RlmF [Bacteroidales bacterium]